MKKIKIMELWETFKRSVEGQNKLLMLVPLLLGVLFVIVFFGKKKTG